MHERLETEETARPLNSTRSHTKLHQEDIKANIEHTDNSKSKATEKITPGKFIIFGIYLICLIQSSLLMQNIEETSLNNISLQESSSNQVDTESGYATVDEKKIAFRDIQTLADVHIWFSSGFVYLVYSSDVSFQSYDWVPVNNTVLYFQVVSPIRLVLNRSPQVASGNESNKYYPYKWTKDQSAVEKQPYGKNGALFNYSDAESGYVNRIPIAYQSKAATIEQYRELQKAGYFDNYMKSLNIDTVIFNKVNNYWAFLQAQFVFSPGGFVDTKILKVFSYPAKPYQDPGTPALAAYQILYMIMFCYYFFQEFLKMYIQIKNALLSNKPSGALSVEEAAKMARKKVKAVLTGILNHIKDPLTFFNVLSISMSFYTIYGWLDYLMNSEINTNIQRLGMVNGVVKDLTPEKKQIFGSFNEIVEKESSKLLLIYQVASLNIVLLMMKALTYVSYVFEPISEFQKIISLVRDRLLPILVMVFSFLFAFSIFVYFYFGSRILEFSDGLVSIIIFFINIINQYFNNVDDMYRLSPGMTMLFVIFFIIFANFILISIFLISSVHTFDDYMQEKHEDVKKKESKQIGPEPHMIWKLRKFCNEDLKYYYYKIVKPKIATMIRVNQEAEEKKLKRELMSFKNFVYDIEIEETEKNKQSNYRFRNERTNFKFARKKKLETVRLCWKIVGSFILILILIIVSLEHHEITEGRSMVNSADHVFDQRSVIYINDAGKKVVSVANRTTEEVQSYPDIVDWLRLFRSFAQKKSIKLSSGDHIEGYFFGGVNYLLTNKYRITIRKATLIENDDPVFSQLSKYTFSATFAPLDVEPEGESTDQLTGLITGMKYNYTKDGSYMNVGGYVIYSDTQDITKVFNTTLHDGILDSSVVCFSIDFPIYQPTTQNVLYGRILATLDDSYNFDIQTSIDLVALNYYNTPTQKFIGFIEITLLICLFILLFRLLRNLKLKHVHYSLWYSLHIAYFPQIMLEMRNKKKPEFLRRYEYFFKFNEITSLIFLMLLFISAVIWMFYLSIRTKVLKEVEMFMGKDPNADIPSLIDMIVWALATSSTSKFFEAMLIFILSFKMIYYYSYFKSFQFITRTIGKSVKQLCTLLIILSFYLLGFSLFLYINLSMKMANYADLFDIFCQLLQMISGLFPKARQELFVENNYYVFTLIFFYIPYIFIIIFLVSYMFLSVMMYYCNQTLEEVAKEDELRVTLGVKEFFVLTYKMLTEKPKKVQLNFQISDQTIYDMRLYEIFDEFRETVELKEKFKSMEMWSYTCSRSILTEYQKRKRVKKLNKEIMQAMLHHEMSQGQDQGQAEAAQRIHENKLRLKYWEYFRIGNFRLYEFMDEFSQINRLLERMTSHQSFIKKKRQSEYKIKKYILYLEKLYDRNMNQIKTLVSIIEKHRKSKIPVPARKSMFDLDQA